MWAGRFGAVAVVCQPGPAGTKGDGLTLAFTRPLPSITEQLVEKSSMTPRA